MAFRFTTLDEATGEPTAQSLSGFLPPNQAPPAGQGGVRYRIALREDAPADVHIPNQATIVFDDNDPITTNVWNHVIDEAAPTTAVDAVEAPHAGEPLRLSWHSEDGLGAGAERYEVYVARDDGTPELHARTTEPQATVSTDETQRIAVTVVAIDALGNVEEKDAPDLQVDVRPAPSGGAGSGGDCGCRVGARRPVAGSLWALALGRSSWASGSEVGFDPERVPVPRTATRGRRRRWDRGSTKSTPRWRRRG